jgi:nickel-type superoxide dismutase maturation protease
MRRLLRSWQSRVAVVGHSMEPTLLDGDWLLVDPDAYRREHPHAGDLVVAVDPRSADRLLVKRVAGIDPAGGLLLAGDHLAHAVLDTEQIPPVDRGALLGRPWFRYWPPRRIGRVRGPVSHG